MIWPQRINPMHDASGIDNNINHRRNPMNPRIERIVLNGKSRPSGFKASGQGIRAFSGVAAVLACLMAVQGLAAQTLPAPAMPISAREWITPPPGDAVRGSALYQSQCISCHAVDSHQTGPAHRGVMGRRVGSAAGYTYSKELAASRLRWTPQTLNVWLHDPEDLIPGQRMGFQVDDAQDRADLIAYLATLKK